MNIYHESVHSIAAIAFSRALCWVSLELPLWAGVLEKSLKAAAASTHA